MERGVSYTIHIDKAWTLEDLYVFPRAYEQVYFAIYSLDPDHDEEDAERIARAYSVFPWQGGYSAVNFYNQLKFMTRKSDRPTIQSMQYASPGWIELASISLNAAFLLEKLVKSVCSSLTTCNATYTDLVKGMHDRKLLRLETREQLENLTGDNLRYVEHSAEKMSKRMAIGNIDDIDKRTGHPYRSAKILFSLYRRVRTLAEYQQSGKADFSNKQ
jgi:hypothetical protein